MERVVRSVAGSYSSDFPFALFSAPNNDIHIPTADGRLYVLVCAAAGLASDFKMNCTSCSSFNSKWQLDIERFYTRIVMMQEGVFEALP